VRPSFHMALFEYPITKPLRLGKWGVCAFWIISTSYVVCITLLNVVAVGYEPVVVALTGTTSTGKLWYEHLPFSSWLPSSTSCNPTQLSLNEGRPFWIAWLIQWLQPPMVYSIIKSYGTLFQVSVLWQFQVLWTTGRSQSTAFQTFWWSPRGLVKTFMELFCQWE
jgi:hypothetical protein